MTTVDNYKLLNTLGSGSFSKVKLAEDSDGNRVALKLMKRESDENGKELQKLFDNEVSIYKKLDHQNITKLLGSSSKAIAHKEDGESLSINYMALEYAEHGEIFDYIAETGAFREKVARYYFHQLIDALEYMHNKGYAHRDLKPENLLLDSDFNLKIADFGFATDARRSQSRKGTFGYMSPEVLAKKEYDPQEADIFAAGVILFVIVTQHSPFNTADPADRYYKLIQQERWEQFWGVYFKDNLSDDFKDLFGKMMCLNPSDRLNIEQIKEHPWYQGKTAKPKEVRKSLYRRYKKFNKKNEKAESYSRRVTKFYEIEDGDILVDAAVQVAEENQYKFKKSKDYYRIVIRIEDENVKTRMQVNVVKKPDTEKRCLELIKITGADDAFREVFDKIQAYLDENF